jgi:hypothetical protein
MRSRLSQLVTAAVIVDGFLAGASADRTVIQLPAFGKAGMQHWAAFSRKADLGDRGYLWYPLLAIGGTGLSVAAALNARSEQLPSDATRWLNAAAVLAAAGLLTTIGAAPNMMRVRTAGEDYAVLKKSFRGFEFWQNIRGPLQALAFVANVLSLRSLQASTSRATRKP